MLVLNRRTSASLLRRSAASVQSALSSFQPEHDAAVGYDGVAAGIDFRPGFFGTCANADCHSGWLHLWRSRSVPVFEGGWTCSPECTAARLRGAVSRELDGRGAMAREGHRHRIPLGLLMLEQGWITQIQLRRALVAQRAAGSGRLGEWLVQQHAVDETKVTRALGVQWSCPVIPLEGADAGSLTTAMPRLFVDAFSALPVRLAAGKMLYLGFAESLDPVLAHAVGRMTGLRVECGVVRSSLFRPAHTTMLNAKFPSVELIEATSATAAAHSLARSVERSHPIASRLVRVHDCLWLRMWLRPQHGPLPETQSVEDVVCSIVPL